MKKNSLLLITVFGLCALVYFFRLGSLPLMDPDEPRYAQSAREMLESGDWINPQLNYENRWDKPVLFYWLVLWSYKIFGISEWGARFPSVLFTMIILLIVYLWGSRCKDRSLGLFSVLVLGMNLQFVIIGRLAITDMTLTCFKTLALFFAYFSWKNRDGRYILYSYLACALAFLTKGPVGVMLPALVFFFFLICTKDFKFLKNCRWIAGITLFIWIALPWYLVEAFLYKDFFSYFFVLHNIKRFATTELEHTEPCYFYLTVLASGFFPWSVFIPRTIWKTFKEYWKDSFYRFFTIWFIIEIVFFMFSKAKVATYILTAFIPLSVLTAKALQDLLESTKDNWTKVEGIILGSSILGVAVFGGLYWSDRFIGTTHLLVFALMPCLTGFMIASVLLIRVRLEHVFKAMVISFIVGAIGIMSLLGTSLGEIRSMKGLAKAIESQSDGIYQIGSFQIFRPSLVYYAGRQVEQIREIDALNKFLHFPHQVFCVMREENYLYLVKEGFLQGVVLVKSSFGKVLISNWGLKKISNNN